MIFYKKDTYKLSINRDEVMSRLEYETDKSNPFELFDMFNLNKRKLFTGNIYTYSFSIIATFAFIILSMFNTSFIFYIFPLFIYTFIIAGIFIFNHEYKKALYYISYILDFDTTINKC